MKPNFSTLVSAIILSTMLNSHLHAAENEPGNHDHDKTVQHGSHEHGHARLTIATTDSGAEITLETPAANIFGFEHLANSDEEHHVVHEAVEKLNTGDSLFNFDEKAECEQRKVDIDSNIASAHDKEKHDHDEHADKHDADEEEKHDHDEHDHASESSHSDVDVSWTFTCKKAEAISQIEIQLFKAFPKGFERLDLEWITQTASGAEPLKADGIIKFKQ